MLDFLSLLAGGVIGFASSYGLHVLTEGRQRKRDMQLLAGALAVEMRVLIAKCEEDKEACEKGGDDVIAWAGDEAYFSVFDGAGHLLYLLPHEVALEAVECYMEMKSSYDSLRQAGKALAQAPLAAEERQGALKVWAVTQTDGAMEKGCAAAEKMRALADKLDSIARG